ILSSNLKVYSHHTGGEPISNNTNPLYLELVGVNQTNVNSWANSTNTATGGPRWRVRKSITVPWDITNAWPDLTLVTSPDISTIIQDIVGTAGYNAGNAIGVIVDYTGNANTSANRHRYFSTGRRSTAYRPRVEGTFTNYRNTVHFPTVDRAIYGDVGMAWDELKITDNTLCNSCEVEYRIHNASNGTVVAGPFVRVAGLSGSQSFDISSVGAQFIYVSASVYRTNTTPQIDDIWLTVTEPSPLPVELTSLSAECDNDKVEIAWTTASELNSSHYIVQRSDDLTSWTDVAIVNGKGNTNTTSNYQVTDYSPLREMGYYRLIQYDMNGEFEEYGPISSKCNYSDFSISLYPNPNDGNFTIRSESDQKLSDVTISITDAAGKVIHVDQTTFGKGTTYYNFKNTNLSKGSYFIHFNHSQKAIKPMKFIVR
ncbi:MAG TPA: T9SS type A sorting domain-containing protein, partial [Brumimicrobium sp.]|nr:T9SS type A sorting domain-containing protein [Brumimicrobium sp.]